MSVSTTASLPLDLRLGAADDPLEHEADDLAASMTGRRPAARPAAPGAPEPYGPMGGPVEERLRRLLQRALFGGRPVPKAERAEAESILGADFGDVRIHTDRTADRLAVTLQAGAFTLGRHIFFRRGAYAPGTPDGRARLLHELTHVAQGSEPGMIRRDYVPAHSFTGRNLKRIGVGERVNLLAKAAAIANRDVLEWVDLSPNPVGTVSATSASGDSFYDAGQPGLAALTCRHKFTKAEFHRHVIEVVAPSGGRMRQAPGTLTRHLPNLWNVSFVGNQYLDPPDVSFHGIEFREGAAPAEYSPTPADWKGQRLDHPDGPWVGVDRALTAADGSKVQGDDWVSSGNHADRGPRPAGPATMTWKVPWFWRLTGAGLGTQFTTVAHIAYDYGGGRARLTKGGVDVSAEFADPAQWFFPDLDTNIAMIKGYYSDRHTAGFGPGITWATIERRLRGFHDIGPLADLLAARREGAWEPASATSPGLEEKMPLNQLITNAAVIWGVSPPT